MGWRLAVEMTFELSGNQMIQLSAKLGFWSSLASAIAFLLFTVCFIAIAMFNPRFIWTNLSDYVAYTEKYN